MSISKGSTGAAGDDVLVQAGEGTRFAWHDWAKSIVFQWNAEASELSGVQLRQRGREGLPGRGGLDFGRCP